MLKRYSWQPEAVGLDVPLSMTDVATAKNYAYTLDANKNVSDLTDAQGNVVAHYEYSPFGTHVATGSYTGNPFRFSSEVFDSETGLIYYNYRYYNPNLGRWINRDPIEEQGGWNLYVMVGNNVSNTWDKWGLACCGKKEYNPAFQGCCESLNHDGSGSDSKVYNLATECCTKHKRVILKSSKVKSKICIRPLDNPFAGWTMAIVHCFLDVPSYGAWGFFGDGKIAPETASAGTVGFGVITTPSKCKTVQCSGCVDDKELGLEISDYRKGTSYPGAYNARKRNCCHWVNDVLVSSGCNGAESYFPGYSLPSHPAPVAP